MPTELLQRSAFAVPRRLDSTEVDPNRALVTNRPKTVGHVAAHLRITVKTAMFIEPHAPSRPTSRPMTPRSVPHWLRTPRCAQSSHRQRLMQYRTKPANWPRSSFNRPATPLAKSASIIVSSTLVDLPGGRAAAVTASLHCCGDGRSTPEHQRKLRSGGWLLRRLRAPQEIAEAMSAPRDPDLHFRGETRTEAELLPAVLAGFMALFHRRVRSARPPLPTPEPSILPWAYFPFKVESDAYAAAVQHHRRTRDESREATLHWPIA
jgi:hypothetical protein